MADSLKGEKVIELDAPAGLVREYNACGLNSIITLLNCLGYHKEVDLEELKKIFDYTQEGVSYERHKFQRLNALLRDKKIPFRFAIEKYTSPQDLFRQLGTTDAPVPVFFWMSILKLTQKHYKNLEVEPDFGDIFTTNDKHVLLFVGHQENGNVILFVDPSYQLPFMPSPKEKLSKHYFIITKKDFYEHTKRNRAMITVKYSKIAAKKYKREKQKAKDLKLK